MPHVIVKLYPGRTDAQKKALADAVTNAVMDTVRCQERSVSVAIEEVTPEDWPEQVYRPDILETKAELVRKPGYNPFEP